MSERRRLDHETPFWITGNPDYFVTLCAKPGGLNQLCVPATGPIILQTIRHYHEQGRWFCHLAVLMPDHVHLLLSFSPETQVFSRVMGEWKKWVTKTCQVTWQRNFFDHRLRNDEQDRNKSDYVLNNPVRAGMIDKPEAWPYTWMPRA